MTYTVIANKLNELERAYNRYAKKANKIGLETSFTVLKTYPKKVTVYENDHINHVTVKTGYTIVEVADVEINFPTYKLGNYTTIAVIEHGDNDNNMVYPCGDVEVPSKYFHGKGICEHCNTKHQRVKTVVLKDTDGNYKQVGTGCLKEYTGVEDVDFVNAFRAFDSIINDCDIANGYFGTVTDTKFTETIDYLAKNIHLIKERGYNKENKYDCCEIKADKLTDKDYEDAEAVINFFKGFETTDAFLHDTKVAVTNEYTKKVNGFVAYAYIAWQKELERIKRKKEKKELVKTTDYFGTVGEKINVKVTGKVITGYATQFGWINIYEFKDEEGHIFIWKTSVDVETNDGTFEGTIRATIKEHNDYNGIKQTVITRAKVVG